jgi:proliferating cell nuclear antigen
MVNVLEIQSVQTGVFKTLIEALKEILSETNIEFDETGIKILATDEAQTVLVHLKLHAERFEIYHCAYRQIKGVDMIKLFKLIKAMTNNDTFTLYIDDERINELGIKIENGEKNECTKYTLKLIDLDETQIDVPDEQFKSSIIMPSSDFQSICRNMSYVGGKNVEIKSIDKRLIFYCEGEDSTQETTRYETEPGTIFNLDSQVTNTDEVIQGYYNLKSLSSFTKCTNLSNNIELCFKNDFPLMIRYSVGSLGELQLLLVPTIRDFD